MKVITIGRSSENNIVINDAKVSRTHLQLVQNDNGVCSVVDLNSANGTFVNGQKITGEVRLQPHDVIRIGNTTLPWQEYIKPSVAAGQKPKDNIRLNPKPNRIWWYVAVCVVFVLVAGGIGLNSYYNGIEQENIEAAKRNQEEIQKEQLRQEAEQKAEEAKRLQDEADELFRQALISQSDESKALAEAKQKEATEAKKQADAATAAQRKAESARIAAEKAKKEAKDRATAAEHRATAAEQDKKEAIQNAEKANTERDSAIVNAKLTEEFYEECSVMTDKIAQQVCTQLHPNLPVDKSKAKDNLKDLFKRANNKGKQEIVDAIKKVVKQQNSKTKTNEIEITSDSLKSSKDAEPTEDKTAVENNE